MTKKDKIMAEIREQILTERNNRKIYILTEEEEAQHIAACLKKPAVFITL